MALTLVTILDHPIAQKYLSRSGLNHAISVAERALTLATKRGLDADTATKAALLHDIGHYEWYTDGTWNYDLYRQNDIHAIKGAERAHKLLIRLGEEPARAKEIDLLRTVEGRCTIYGRDIYDREISIHDVRSASSLSCDVPHGRKRSS